MIITYHILPYKGSHAHVMTPSRHFHNLHGWNACYQLSWATGRLVSEVIPIPKNYPEKRGYHPHQDFSMPVHRGYWPFNGAFWSDPFTMPWIVHIFKKVQHSDDQFICMGVLMNETELGPDGGIDQSKFILAQHHANLISCQKQFVVGVATLATLNIPLPSSLMDGHGPLINKGDEIIGLPCISSYRNPTVGVYPPPSPVAVDQEPLSPLTPSPAHLHSLTLHAESLSDY
uniref:Uncharacterized protein n=1 Tax=Romanomermis culicivorax TaxID=13658 RepID=A0A915JUS6_ROMCU